MPSGVCVQHWKSVRPGGTLGSVALSKNTPTQPAVLLHACGSWMESQAPGRHWQVGQPVASEAKPNGQARSHNTGGQMGPPLLLLVPPEEEEPHPGRKHASV